MNIFHVSFECYPLAKVGGLADVVGSLPKYQHVSENTSSVIAPHFDNEFTQKNQFEDVHHGKLKLGIHTYDFNIKRLQSKNLGFPLYTVHIGALLFRKEVYGYEDDIQRFLSFQLAVLHWISSFDNNPDIIHCHDYHTGFIPFLINHATGFIELSQIPLVFTIHNAQYQGEVSYDVLKYFPEFNTDMTGLLDWNYKINPLAAAIKCAWKVTTVSPSYMKELQVRANGLEVLLTEEKEKCVGVLNGIDIMEWNPETDPMLIKNYIPNHVISGKKANKNWLCNHYNLDANKPLFVFIGRLVYEKGAELLPEVVTEVLNHLDCNIFILGSGDKNLERRLEALKGTYEGKYNAYLGYDETLSHRLYAGADFLIMPSRVEPCGLNQMYALRYGTIPIVRRTGGLKDTIIDIGDGGFGICHDQVLVWDITYSVKRGVQLYEDQPKFRKIQKQIFKIDHSWNSSAENIYTFINQ